MSNHEIWQAVLAELELSISKPNFVTWFKNTDILSYQDGCIILCLPSEFAKLYVEKKYNQMIVKSLERVTGKPIKRLEYKICNIKNITSEATVNETETRTNEEYRASPTLTPVFSNETRTPPRVGEFGLNQKYVFETFVVGGGSELAYAAAQAVVNKPGEAYNPLFIYGGVGLGKTHLLQAIGNHILAIKPDTSIMYASAEKFTNDYISSMRDGSAKNFQNRYRNIDVLLIDDIQFISGKEKSQESFFHTFNDLHQQNKQVVMTSDRPPKAIPALEDRLKSRFEWGMIVDVAPPDLETRIAILQKKCIEKNFALPQNILPVVAATFQRNIRELEGALNKIIAFHQLKAMEPTLESVKSLLSSLEVRSIHRSVTPQQIIDAASQFYAINIPDLLGQSREKKFSFPRQIIMHLMRKELSMSYPAIGNELGGRDHTTAMHADNKITRESENDLKLKQEIELIKQKLYINMM
ncbi:MAG: chromosomal replication initiator protein DnaA [Candidatus Magasanikbacteria bacterium GW2011_GWA2_40_10]|uniref:Chromosomal replication initiator protein DnaA n=1 Tax=Candidatus Magasanikbacteria bacterium GW2011_GWA2_40_10 TaxID=1619037 RepID=A0A0G0TAE3_9BACT|nr:MAG: chromosomal replication initiator protein DnaA [Candidatus Magasanikbacteria bacterium GW2011_GWA2_40_10]